MTAPFRLFGAAMSPYAGKVRAYLAFKGVEHVWTPRTAANQDEYARYAKLPLSPLLIDAEEMVLQDSTPMIEALENAYPEPAIIPDDAGLAFLSALLEDYADEWLNKAMLHYRWGHEADRMAAAKRTLDMLFESAEAPEGLEASIATRMAGRLHHAGATPESAPLIETSFARVLHLLEDLLKANVPYMFGGRPCLADFGLYGQFAQIAHDPTPAALLRDTAPALLEWLERMGAPRVEGPFNSFAHVSEAIEPLLRDEIGGHYLRWMLANAEAVAEDAPGVRLEFETGVLVQKPQRYAAKAFAELRRKRRASEHDGLSALLAGSGCAAYLAADDVEPDEDDPASSLEPPVSDAGQEEVGSDDSV